MYNRMIKENKKIRKLYIKRQQEKNEKKKKKYEDIKRIKTCSLY